MGQHGPATSKAFKMPGSRRAKRSQNGAKMRPRVAKMRPRWVKKTPFLGHETNRVG